MKAVIFDLFGTLCSSVDPEKSIIEKFKVDGFDYKVIENVVCGYKFDNWENFFKSIAKTISIGETKDNFSILEEIFQNAFDNCYFFSVAQKVLINLKEQGYLIGLISNSFPGSRRLIERAELIKYFENNALFLSYEIGMLKPNPQIFTKCLDAMGIEAINTVMVGDDLENDIKASKQATNGKIGGILVSKNQLIAQSRVNDFIVIRDLEELVAAIRFHFSSK